MVFLSMIFGHGIMILILLYKVMIAEYLTLWTPCIIFCAITILNDAKKPARDGLAFII